MLLKVGEYSNIQPDMSLEGIRRRLSATRGVIRYRDGKTKRKHFCHDPVYRVAYIVSVLKFREQIRSFK